MKVRFSLAPLALTLVSLFAACDDDTATIGGNIMPQQDFVSTDQSVYSITTRSVKSGAVVANTNSCYLGSIIDPETRVKTTGSYLAQFHVQEGYKLPPLEMMVRDEQGGVIIDSCVIRILHDEYIGDSLTTLKVTVQELDTNRVMKENTTYYTDLNPADYVSTTSPFSKTVSYSALDQTKSENVLSNSTLYRSIPIRMDNALGARIISKYYENADFYRNSYNFAHHVCAGFYFQHTGGLGTMIKSDATLFDIYYRYHSKTTAGNDTIVVGLQRLASTEEVIQNTQVENEIPEALIAATNPFTYIKSPAGVYTEATIPVSDIVSGTHYSDTINSATFTLRTYNAEEQSRYNLPRPERLLMVRASQVEEFFVKNRLPDSKTSFLAQYNAVPNTYAYAFANIGPLISVLRAERDKGAGVLPSDSESVRQAKWSQWEAENPDWNKVAILPVTTEYTTTTSIYGTTSSTLSRVRNAYGLSSVKLEGGLGNPIELSVIYSRFKQ